MAELTGIYFLTFRLRRGLVHENRLGSNVSALRTGIDSFTISSKTKFHLRDLKTLPTITCLCRGH